MESDWREARLSDLGEIGRGRSRHRPRNAPHLYGGEYPFVQTGDVRASNGRITHHSQTYSEAGFAQSRLWPAGTMAITIAANIAETAVLTYPACFPDSVVGFIANPKKCDVRFVEYMFRSLRARIRSDSNGAGSAQDNINLGTLEKLRFLLPPLRVQRAIADTLSVLDDKIELNRRRNETLENTALTLFKDWFVDFGPVRAKIEGREPYFSPEMWEAFPGRFTESKLGEVPEGWIGGSFVDVISQRTERVGGRGAVVLSAVASGDLVRSDDHFEKRVYSKEIAGYLAVEQWDFAYNPSRINIGSIGMLEEDVLGAVSPVYVVFRPKMSYRWFVKFAISLGRTTKWINTLASGSVRQSLSFSGFSSIPCALPPELLVDEFNRRWMLFRSGIEAREKESKILGNLRDALLPRLVSGELRVRDAEQLIKAQTA